ncbi:MAG: domain containing protein [Fibrobacteres bacterium]|nr:domain containing protein [Fibrobacterota bacterium]
MTGSIPSLRGAAAFLAVCLACMPAVSPAHGAPVDPNPLSLLKHKRVLIINGDNDPEYHKAPRDILTGKINLIKAAVGIATLKVVGNADTMTFATLDDYDLIFFNYFTRAEYFLGKPFEKGFKEWVSKGNRGIVGNHNTGAKTRGEWDWFRDTVTSMWYMDHKDGSQPGTIHMTTDPAVSKLPILDKLDAKFTGSDEWYSFDMKPWHPVEAPTWKDCKVLYTLDEKSVAKLTDAMGAYHPVAWIREDALKNRFFYTTLIHSDAGANSDFYHSLILRAMEYAAGYQDPVSMGGAAIKREDGVSFVSSSRRVDVDVRGAFTLSIWSASGEKLYAAAGAGKQSLAPDPLAKAGLYFVRLESESGSFRQRVMIY